MPIPIMPPCCMPLIIGMVSPCIIGGVGEEGRSCAAAPTMPATSATAVTTNLRCVGLMRASYVLTLPVRVIFPLVAKVSFFCGDLLVKLPDSSGMRIDLRQHGASKQGSAERNSTEPCRDPDIFRNDSDARQRRDDTCGINSQILN